MNGFQTANAHTGANGGRLSSANTDQRRWVSASAGIGKASTRPSRSTRSRQTGAGMIFESRRTVAERAEEQKHPWKVTLKTDGGNKLAVIEEGLIFDGLLSITKITPTLTEDIVIDGDLVCLEYTYATGAIRSIIVPSADPVFVPYTENEEDPPVLLTVRQPVASIAENTETTNLEVEQIQLGNSLAITSACVREKILKFFTAI